MPLGNWTSQFFANSYLNEIDKYVKHGLKARYYIRYVDDFVILNKYRKTLKLYEEKINCFLQNNLKLESHSSKSKIRPLGRGISLLGFRVFYHYKIVRKRNLRKIKARLSKMPELYDFGSASAYDILEVLKGWNGYAIQGNTYGLRQKLEEYVKEKLGKGCST